jgi:ABC-type polysaccharide/polyol phosphate export permease
LKALALLPDLLFQVALYREYLVQSVIRDLKTKYKRSVLGYLWTMLHPLAMMSILAVVFSGIMRLPVQDYAIFIFCGMLPFHFFQSTVVMSLNTIRANARLFGQVPVPKYLFVLSLTFSNLFNYIVALVPLLILTLVLGRAVPLTVLAFPIVVLPVVMVTLGVSLVLATSNVFFEDTHHLSVVGLQALYFLTPILYRREDLPSAVAEALVVVNPLFHQVEFLRGLFYYGALPDPLLFGANIVLSFAILLAGLWLFKSCEDRFMYFI